MLQQQLQQQASLRKDSTAETQPKEADGSNSTPSLPEEQSRELLRLRGEVGVLRRQLITDALDHAANQRPEQHLSHEQTRTLTEADFNEEQLKSLVDLTSKLETGNSVADLADLKDGLERWDELFMNRAAAEQKPVLAVLKERLKERIAELEAKK
jgi:hypothetical protein